MKFRIRDFKVEISDKKSINQCMIGSMISKRVAFNKTKMSKYSGPVPLIT